MNWKPGDRAIVKGLVRDVEYNGEIVVIKYIENWPDDIGTVITTDVGHFYPENLFPIDDDYDGHQVTTWDELEDIWTPGVTV